MRIRDISEGYAILILYLHTDMFNGSLKKQETGQIKTAFPKQNNDA